MENIDNETVKVNYMRPKKVRTADFNEHPRHFRWPTSKDRCNTKTECISPVRPSDLILAVPPSTVTNLIFGWDNVDIIDKFSV